MRLYLSESVVLNFSSRTGSRRSMRRRYERSVPIQMFVVRPDVRIRSFNDKSRLLDKSVDLILPLTTTDVRKKTNIEKYTFDSFQLVERLPNLFNIRFVKFS